MNPNEVLRIVDAIHRDKNIDQEIVFQAIESAYATALRKYYGEEADVVINIDRDSGAIAGAVNGEAQEDLEETIGRIGAQTAKQVIIQKIREAERDALYSEYDDMIGQMLSGVVQRNEGGAATVALGNVEAILPRSEQIPGETHHANERVRAVVCEVRKQGSRVKVILSRTRPQLVQRLFEQEIPEIAEGVIMVDAMAREPGYRTKVAVSSTDQRIDCVGACVGVRGNRIKNIVDELAGERIDIVRFSDDLQVLIPNALQPAEIEEVILCEMLGRAIVLVREDQLSLAIGRRGQNVRLASKLCGRDIEIMTREELEEQIERAVVGFSEIDGVSDEVAERLVGEGYLSYDDLSVIEPDDLMEMGGLTAEQVDHIVEQAEERALVAEAAAAQERRLQKEQQRLEKERQAAQEAAGETGAEPAPAEET
ncbi:MAG: transcription termination factor NusA, partial [Planctomycetales bacterium]|nr:transcription termination factor NusA [Planctomycetales bacterium]